MKEQVMTIDLSAVPVVECQPRAGLPNVLAKLAADDTVRVAYFGGSITQADGWRVQTDAWLREAFPAARVEMIHAAIGGTGSALGAFRLERDVLAYQPDLIFVEFAVNDSGVDPSQILLSMEGIVRKVRRLAPACDLCFVYTLADGMTAMLRAGTCPPSVAAHELVADHYGIPSIQLGLEVARLEEEGALIFTVPEAEKATVEASGRIAFSGDGCHPYVEGHHLYTAAVQRAFARLAGIGAAGPHALPAPRDAANWETARMTPIGKASVLGRVRRLDKTEWPPIAWSAESLDEVWLTEAPGDGLVLRFTGTGLGISDVIGPDVGQLDVVIDGGPCEPVVRFDSYCLYHRPSYGFFVTDLPAGAHEIRLALHPASPDKAAILARLGNVMDDPARFAANHWYPAALLVLGEMETSSEG